MDTHDLSLYFDHGAERRFDLRWCLEQSKACAHDTEPYFFGLGGYDPFVHDAEKNHHELHKLVNRGSPFVYSDCKGLVAQQRGDGTIIVYASGKRRRIGKRRADTTYTMQGRSRMQFEKSSRTGQSRW